MKAIIKNNIITGLALAIFDLVCYGAIIGFFLLVFSSCAYQRYNSQNFKPDKKEYKCRTYEKPDNVKNTIRYYYRQR